MVVAVDLEGPAEEEEALRLLPDFFRFPELFRFSFFTFLTVPASAAAVPAAAAAVGLGDTSLAIVPGTTAGLEAVAGLARGFHCFGDCFGLVVSYFRTVCRESRSLPMGGKLVVVVVTAAGF